MGGGWCELEGVCGACPAPLDRLPRVRLPASTLRSCTGLRKKTSGASPGCVVHSRTRALCCRGMTCVAYCVCQATTIKYVAMGAAFAFMFWRLTDVGVVGWIKDWACRFVYGEEACIDELADDPLYSYAVHGDF